MAVQRERLWVITGVHPQVVSFHNPEAIWLTEMHVPMLAGMVNVYGSVFRENYEYCSDSNGYWRFKPLMDVLVKETSSRLHVLAPSRMVDAHAVTASCAYRALRHRAGTLREGWL